MLPLRMPWTPVPLRGAQILARHRIRGIGVARGPEVSCTTVCVPDPVAPLVDVMRCMGVDVAELPLPYDLHPDAAAHRHIGDRFAELAFGSGGLLAAG